MESRYYEASTPGFYGGVRALARYSELPVRAVWRWLEKQDPYTLHKPTVERFLCRKTFAKPINNVFQADLADMRNLASFNNGYSYILTCIDVLSRYAFAVPVKDKRGLNVSVAFGKITAERTPSMF
jgi:hypothetical protein